jgi:hypothetical protein
MEVPETVVEAVGEHMDRTSMIDPPDLPADAAADRRKGYVAGGPAGRTIEEMKECRQARHDRMERDDHWQAQRTGGRNRGEAEGCDDARVKVHKIIVLTMEMAPDEFREARGVCEIKAGK